jgi:hypothetical protein
LFCDNTLCESVSERGRHYHAFFYLPLEAFRTLVSEGMQVDRKYDVDVGRHR